MAIVGVVLVIAFIYTDLTATRILKGQVLPTMRGVWDVAKLAGELSLKTEKTQKQILVRLAAVEQAVRELKRKEASSHGKKREETPGAPQGQ